MPPILLHSNKILGWKNLNSNKILGWKNLQSNKILDWKNSRTARLEKFAQQQKKILDWKEFTQQQSFSNKIFCTATLTSSPSLV